MPPGPQPAPFAVVPDAPRRLRQLIDRDQANLICLDCKANLADHASLTYGVFICEECAEMHLQELGPQVSFIRSLFKNSSVALAHWDEYSLRMMETAGGNHNFRKFMMFYKLRCKETYKRYRHKAAVYYSKQLRTQVDGLHMAFKPPSHHFTHEEVAYFTSIGIDPANFFFLKRDEEESTIS